MKLGFLEQTPEQALKKLVADLTLIDPKFNVRQYTSMSPRQLEAVSEKIKRKENKMILESKYASWLGDENFTKLKLLSEMVEIIRTVKEERIANEKLVPGFTYYRGVKQFGPILEGTRCHLTEDGSMANWVPFCEKVAVAKAFQVLSAGTPTDFRRIYMEMADGRPNALLKVSVEHITESSDEALRAIEAYCNARWDGAWPWEINSPMKLRNLIEDNHQMNKTTIQEMHAGFNRLLRMLAETEMEKYQVIDLIRQMSDQVDSMISNLGKISSGGIEAAAGARSTMGDSAASAIENALQQPVNDAAQALSALKAAIDGAVDQLQGQSEGGQMDGGQMDGGDLGTPADALGGLGGEEADLAAKLSDVNLDGSDRERPMKGM